MFAEEGVHGEAAAAFFFVGREFTLKADEFGAVRVTVLFEPIGEHQPRGVFLRVRTNCCQQRFAIGNHGANSKRWRDSLHNSRRRAEGVSPDTFVISFTLKAIRAYAPARLTHYFSHLSPNCMNTFQSSGVMLCLPGRMK